MLFLLLTLDKWAEKSKILPYTIFTNTIFTGGPIIN